MVYVSQIIMLCSKSSTYESVLFQEQVGKSNHLFVKSNKVSLSIQLTQSGHFYACFRAPWAWNKDVMLLYTVRAC